MGCSLFTADLCVIQSIVALRFWAIAGAKKTCAICTLGIDIHASKGRVAVAMAMAFRAGG